MSDLRGFFAENAEKVGVVEYAASKRFKDENGDPLLWKIECIESTEDETLRKNCMGRVPIPGKKNRYMQDMDSAKYAGSLAARCTIHPNLKDAALQNSYGVMGEVELLKAMLTPGEYADYLLKVQEVNGFDTTFEETVEEAKN